MSDPSEHFPLSPIDDLMIHNYPEPLRVMYTGSPHAYERLWFVAHDQLGELMVVHGMGIYPNLNTADAFSIVNYRGQHTTVRAYRLLGVDRTNLRIGPINAELIEGLRTWRLTLEENELGISYDILWNDTTRAIFQQFPTHYHQGRSVGVTVGFETFGYAEGWVSVAGQRFELQREQYTGTRDRHWGTRNGVGGARHWIEMPAFGGAGQMVAFKDYGIWCNRVLYNLGDPRPGAAQIVRQDRRLRFDPQTKLFAEGIVTSTLADGRQIEVHYSRLNNQTVFLRCGGYARRIGGGTPGTDIWSGQYVADFHVEGETLDVNDPEVQEQLAGVDDHHCVVRCDGETSYGLFETYDPGYYEMCRAGIPGYSLLE